MLFETLALHEVSVYAHSCGRRVLFSGSLTVGVRHVRLRVETCSS